MALEADLNKGSRSSFELVFPVVPGDNNDLVSNEELTLNIYETVIPGVTIEALEQKWQGAKTRFSSSALDFENWNVSFVVDEQFKNWKLLFRWLMFMNNNDNRFERKSDEYKVDATLRILGNFREHIFKLTFINMWINSLTEVSLSHREGDQIIEAQANFIYDRYEIVEN